MTSDQPDELTPASMEAAARPFAEPCARNLREWAESDYDMAIVSRLDLKRVMQEYDRRGELLAKVRGVVMRVEDEYTFTREVVTIFDAEGKP